MKRGVALDITDPGDENRGENIDDDDDDAREFKSRPRRTQG